MFIKLGNDIINTNKIISVNISDSDEKNNMKYVNITYDSLNYPVFMGTYTEDACERFSYQLMESNNRLFGV